MLEIVVRSQIVKFRRFRQAVNSSTCLSTFGCIMKHPILFPDTKCPDRAFAGRIINRNISVCQKNLQILFLIYTVAESLGFVPMICARPSIPFRRSVRPHAMMIFFTPAASASIFCHLQDVIQKSVGNRIGYPNNYVTGTDYGICLK